MNINTASPSESSSDLVYYPNASGVPVRLVRDPKKFSVRFGIGRTPLSPEGQELLRKHTSPVNQVPHYGITVYEIGSQQEQTDAVNVLNRERDVDLAAPVLHRERQDADDIYLTRHFVVQFWPEVSRQQIDALNAKYGVEIIEPLGYAENGFLLLAPAGSGGTGSITMANIYRASGLTVFSHPDLVSKRHKRNALPIASSTASTKESTKATAAARSAAAVRADYQSRQWHLATARVTDAWSMTKGTPSIAIAILDDGIDVDHPEFAGKVGMQYDFTAHVADSRPKSSADNHGTACSGVATAKGVHASGAAPGCSLIAGRFPSTLGDADEAKMFQWAADNHADVISCSWGPADGTGNADPLPGSTQAAIAYCVKNGRGGKGIPVCFAAGNGDESVDLDGYASNPDVIAVAASNDHEVRSWYSDHGNAIWICAPSSGDSDVGEKAILTTDRHGPDGYNAGSGDVDADYTSSFGGTSSASPLVAGIIGLMISANPDLTVQQVRSILRDTARKIGSGYDSTGHSPEYGYGRVDAYEAVRTAQATGGGVAPVSRDPGIVGPTTFDRSGAAPQFQVDPGDGASIYYAVEVAIRPELFDDANHGAERSANSFYASWQDSAFYASDPYQLPDSVWQRLCAADALYYRAWFSSSNSDWVNTVVTTADADYASAPFVTLAGSAITRDAPVRREVAETHAGLDRLAYPGDDIMRNLYDNTNLAWTGFYLAPSPSQGYTGWMDKASTLRSMGWGLAPVFVGQQWSGGPGSHILTTEQGTADAKSAIELADQAGIGENAVVYLDIEIGGLLPPSMLAYAQAWFDGIRSSNYRPGVYCSFLNTPAQLREKNPDLYYWVFNINKFGKTQTQKTDGSFQTPPMSDSGCNFAIAWQYIQGAPSIPVPQSSGAQTTLSTVDMDCATVLDPSYPERSGAGTGTGSASNTGGSGAQDGTRPPTIVGPSTMNRSDPAPQFEIDPGTGPATYYAVEVATRAELFASDNNGTSRTSDTFYASWQDAPFQSSNPYSLPETAWEQLRAADKLYYRAWFSSSDTIWADTTITISDAASATAPFIAVSGQIGERDALSRQEHPTIRAPDSMSRDDEPPVFTFSLTSTAATYVIEVATRPALLDVAEAAGRSSDNYYASPVLPASVGTMFGLPADAWLALRTAPHLYYRISTAPTRGSTGWHAQDSSTPDTVVERAPWIVVLALSAQVVDPDQRVRYATDAGPMDVVVDPDELLWRRKLH